MTAMMVLLREMDLETDSELGGEGAITAGEKREVTPNERLVLEFLIESRELFDQIDPYGLWRYVLRISQHVCFPGLCLTGLNTRISLSQLYGSSSAVSVICQAICNMTMTRALFCRDLLILQKLYLCFGDNVCNFGFKLLELDRFGTLTATFTSTSGVSWWGRSVVAAPAGPDSSELPPPVILSCSQTRQSEPGLLCPHGHHVSTHLMLPYISMFTNCPGCVCWCLYINGHTFYNMCISPHGSCVISICTYCCADFTVCHTVCPLSKTVKNI